IIEPIVVKPLDEGTVGVERRLESPFYFAILGVVLVVLLFTLKGNFDAFKALQRTTSGFNMEKIKTDIDIYNAVNGRYPSSLEAVTKENDPWGKPYIYETTDRGFKLFSAGPDGVAQTKDDVY
ncbi:MAG TPA: hypothetical protein ENG80_01395, partial [Nitrospirae bacterium]|nr:hypothetical protein [Nitrospirota bacterium]